MVTMIALIVVLADVLPMMVVCALAAVVVVAAFDDPGMYRNRALLGALVGMSFGIIDHYPVRILVSALTSPLSDPMDRLISVSIGVIFTACAATVAGAAVAGQAGPTSRSVRRCAVIGAGFGLAAGIANAAVAMAVPGVGIEPTTDIVVVLAMVSAVVALSVVAQIAIDAVLAVIAFRFVRRKWGAAPPATAI